MIEKWPRMRLKKEVMQQRLQLNAERDKLR
jgi:hypothetical protein